MKYLKQGRSKELVLLQAAPAIIATADSGSLARKTLLKLSNSLVSR